MKRPAYRTLLLILLFGLIAIKLIGATAVVSASPARLPTVIPGLVPTRTPQPSPTPTPEPIVIPPEEIGSTDLISVLAGALVLIVVAPILFSGRIWRQNGTPPKSKQRK